MTKIRFASAAYAKLLRHAAKHPTARAVTGVLIGRPLAGEAETVEVVNIVPFFHSNVALNPQLTLALMMAEEYCKGEAEEAAKLKIAGYYHLQPSSTSPANAKNIPIQCVSVAAGICANYPEAVVLSGGTKNLWEAGEAESLPAAFKPKTRITSATTKPEFAPLAAGHFTIENRKDAIESALKEFSYLTVADFDDHLADPSVSFLPATPVAT